MGFCVFTQPRPGLARGAADLNGCSRCVADLGAKNLNCSSGSGVLIAPNNCLHALCLDDPEPVPDLLVRQAVEDAVGPHGREDALNLTIVLGDVDHAPA